MSFYVSLEKGILHVLVVPCVLDTCRKKLKTVKIICGSTLKQKIMHSTFKPITITVAENLENELSNDVHNSNLAKNHIEDFCSDLSYSLE